MAEQVDVTIPRSVAALFTAWRDASRGMPGLVVNVASIGSSTRLRTHEGDPGWVDAVNHHGVRRCCVYAVRAMERTGGAIVNVTSITTSVRTRGGLAELAARAAVMSLTKQLAQEQTASGIEVRCVCPTAVDWRSHAGAAITRDAPRCHHARGLEALPGATARAVASLVDPDCAFPSGAAVVAGGV